MKKILFLALACTITAHAAGTNTATTAVAIKNSSSALPKNITSFIQKALPLIKANPTLSIGLGASVALPLILVAALVLFILGGNVIFGIDELLDVVLNKKEGKNLFQADYYENGTKQTYSFNSKKNYNKKFNKVVYSEEYKKYVMDTITFLFFLFIPGFPSIAIYKNCDNGLVVQLIVLAGLALELITIALVSIILAGLVTILSIVVAPIIDVIIACIAYKNNPELKNKNVLVATYRLIDEKLKTLMAKRKAIPSTKATTR